MNIDVNGTQEYFIRYSYIQETSETTEVSWITATRRQYFDGDYSGTTLDSLLYEVERYLEDHEGRYNIDFYLVIKFRRSMYGEDSDN